MVTETKGRSLEEIEADLQEAAGMVEEGEERFTRERGAEKGPATRAGS